MSQTGLMSLVKISIETGMATSIIHEVFRFVLLTDFNLAGGYKTFSMLNSAEHEIYPAHKC